MEFRECPQSFLLKYVYKVPQPPSPVLAKGTMVHSALENMFDLKKNDRTLANLHNLLRKAWSDAKTNPKTPQYATLHKTVEEEREWGKSALALLDNYANMEDPSRLESDPVKREMWVRAKLPSIGAQDHVLDEKEFLVRGIIDRLDLLRTVDGEVVLCVTDYKTGKSPHLKYAPSTNNRIVEEKFWQLKVYALLLRDMRPKDAEIPKVAVRKLRLMFLTSESGAGEFLEYDLGQTEKERNAKLEPVKKELGEIWGRVQKLVDGQEPRMFEHCERAFCFCHPVRKLFAAGQLADNGYEVTKQ